ncbi:unnamed protein product [Caretta caretta]
MLMLLGYLSGERWSWQSAALWESSTRKSLPSPQEKNETGEFTSHGMFRADWSPTYSPANGFLHVGVASAAELVAGCLFHGQVSDTRPADAGTYRCVKFKKVSGAGEEDKKGSAADEEFRSGAGTAVTVSGEDRHQVAVSAAAGTVCVLLVVLVLVSTYFFVRKKRGRSPSTARSQTPFPDTTRTQSQPSDDKDPDVLYADLQHPARLQQPKQSAPEEHSEYAAIKDPDNLSLTSDTLHREISTVKQPPGETLLRKSCLKMCYLAQGIRSQ